MKDPKFQELSPEPRAGGSFISRIMPAKKSTAGIVGACSAMALLLSGGVMLYKKYAND